MSTDPPADDIAPDDKNWTWVLERRCGDCGFDSSGFDPARIAAAVTDQIDRWASVLGRVDVSVRPRRGVWSPLEYSCHVRDVFRVFDTRVARMIAEVDPQFENWDQDRTAVEDRYDRQDPSVVAVELAEAGRSLAARYATVSGDLWERRGFRSDGSVFTLATLAQYLIHDPVHHLWDVVAEVPLYRD